MTHGVGRIINRSDIAQSGGKALRVALAAPENPGATVGYVYPLEAELNYTSIGTCSGGRLVFASSTLGLPYSYLLRVQLYNSGTWETIWLGTHLAPVKSGDEYQVDLVSLWDVIANDFADLETSPIYPRIGFIVLGTDINGAALSVQASYGMTWEQYYKAVYEGVDEAQWGYTADGWFIAGTPSSFTFAAYTNDNRTLSEDSQGYSELDYLTAYKGINDELNSDNEVYDTRDLGVLVPRKTEVISWNPKFADVDYSYSWTRTFPNDDNIIIPIDPLAPPGSQLPFIELAFGSNQVTSPGKDIAVRIRIRINQLFDYLQYDDITKLELLIKFTGTSDYVGSTFTFSGVGWMGGNRPYPWEYYEYGLRWVIQEYLNQNLVEFQYPQMIMPALVQGFYSSSYNNLPTYGDFDTNVVGLKWTGDFRRIQEIQQDTSNYILFIQDDPFDNPNYQLNFGVGMGFDDLGAGGAGITAEVSFSFTARKNSAGWIVPPEFYSSAYGGPTSRYVLNGLFAPPFTIDGTRVAGSTVRITGDSGVTTEALTTILPARQLTAQSFRRRR